MTRTATAILLAIVPLGAQHLKTTVAIVARHDLPSTYTLASGSVATAGAVMGHELALKLPDGRTVAVVCRAKSHWTDWSQGAYRSCRVPLGDTAKADFDGKHVKLTWPVSLDGKKTESETYDIVEVEPATVK